MNNGTITLSAQEKAAIQEAIKQKRMDEASTSTVEAIGEMICMRPTPRPMITKAGIHLPDDDEDAPRNQYGKVLSIGPAVDPAKCPVKVGDEVVIGKYIEIQPDIGGHKFILVPWQAVLGKIERQA